MGKLEIITCGATHGFLPLMDINPKAVRAQIQVAATQYEKLFGRRARGIWLPECGYQPGHDEFLKEAGIRYFYRRYPRYPARLAATQIRRLRAGLLQIGRGGFWPRYGIVESGLERRRRLSRRL